MNKILILVISLIFSSSVLGVNENIEAKWITTSEAGANNPNTWIAFRKDIKLDKTPEVALAQIAVDSKYWLWINGELANFEGGLKRGPNPKDSYYDEVDLAPYLKKGENKLAILVWYFGKDGYSHKDSKKSGLLFNLKTDNKNYVSNDTWQCLIHPAFEGMGDPQPNIRLPESNLKYDSNKGLGDWQTKNNIDFKQAIEIGNWGDAPWNALVKRIIPQWKDFGVKSFAKHETIYKGLYKDTIVYRFPYNMQMTPIIDVTDHKGEQSIEIYTDHTYAAGDINLRAEYITQKGTQNYESLGWLNGHKLLLVVPHGIDVNKVSYRETGYNSEVIGTFHCDNEFYMKFWDKALRTLYVNMRDTFFDCPERERAQWWGDVVLLMAECFYTHSEESHLLMKKAILELIAWQREDGVIFSPSPAGNWTNELPGQMLASVGWYGFWNYYMNTGDLETIKTVYPGVKRYLDIWELDDTGLTQMRYGDWTWGDWGVNKDMRLIYAGWHYLALKSAKEMALLTNNVSDAEEYQQKMDRVKIGYNKCWNGVAYRHPTYHDTTDDRVQALAVLAGIADESKYEKIIDVLKSQHHASPYMEKYVMEALFKMGDGEYAMNRAQQRYDVMVNHKEYTTLFEGFSNWDELGGGTVNHAWSGGPLINIAKEICGIYPLEPAYKVFKIEPDPTFLKETEITVPSIAGKIKSGYKSSADKFELNIVVPKNTEAIVYLPIREYSKISINGKVDNGKIFHANNAYQHLAKKTYQFKAGEYKLIME